MIAPTERPQWVDRRLPPWPITAVSDRVALARTIASRAKGHFVEVKRERSGGRIVLRSAELLAIKQGRWAEKERERLMRQWENE
jgi:hypothetical protein